MSAPTHGSWRAAVIPFLFVILWSSGFIGSKLGVTYAEPFTFLSIRYGIVLLILIPVAWFMRAPWPKTRRQVLHLAISGLLIHATYLAGCVWSLRLGLSAGVLSLIVSLQPLVTATFAGSMLGEVVLPRQWTGLALGFIGTALVVANKIGIGLNVITLLPAFAALIGITAGTMWQKRHCPSFDLRTGAVVQYAASLLITATLAVSTETMQVSWTWQFVFALAWLSLVLSIGAISLLNHLITRGTAVNVSSLFYAVPAVTTLMAWALFNERLTGMALIGMAVAISGVMLARRKQSA